ncbi:ROK family protein [Kitasatospora sp. HPMI-4]|uniref:ROK family protein n=1 Tax=Kitasatospora sp. HPMI-4 TaxID=3448443 RepID=UPI003F1CDF53
MTTPPLGTTPPRPSGAGEAEAVGLDVGATKIAALRITRDGTVLARARCDTPRGSAQDLVATLADLVKQVRGDRVAAVGAGLPGMVDARTGALVFAPGLDFARAPLRELIEEAVGLPVRTDNDANTAAWAEYRLGAGRGHDHMVLVTIGSGLGCGMVVGGRLLRGSHGYAAEVSHLVVDPRGPRCECGAYGCWGVSASGRAIARLGCEAVAARPASPLARLIGPEPSGAGEAVTRAAGEGDPEAAGILARVGALTGRGLAALANMLDPSVLVVGGGPISAGELLLGPARASFDRWLYSPADRPPVPIVPARFGNEAGAIGAALLALEELAGRSPAG